MVNNENSKVNCKSVNSPLHESDPTTFVPKHRLSAFALNCPKQMQFQVVLGWITSGWLLSLFERGLCCRVWKAPPWSFQARPLTLGRWMTFGLFQFWCFIVAPVWCSQTADVCPLPTVFNLKFTLHYYYLNLFAISHLIRFLSAKLCSWNIFPGWIKVEENSHSLIGSRTLSPHPHVSSRDEYSWLQWSIRRTSQVLRACYGCTFPFRGSGSVPQRTRTLGSCVSRFSSPHLPTGSSFLGFQRGQSLDPVEVLLHTVNKRGMYGVLCPAGVNVGHDLCLILWCLPQWGKRAISTFPLAEVSFRVPGEKDCCVGWVQKYISPLKTRVFKGEMYFMSLGNIAERELEYVVSAEFNDGPKSLCRHH